MTQDLSQNIRDQLSQAIQEQDVLVQQKAIGASLEFIQNMRKIEIMPCKLLTAEELDKMRDSILNIASCDECSQPAQDNVKCDNCGDTLCSDCCYLDENIMFCFECYMNRQTWHDEDEEI